MLHVVSSLNGCVLAPRHSQGDAIEAFKRVFGRFATAEQVTGAAPLDDDDDAEDAGAAKVSGS
jgi:hypothetical protein